MRYYFLLRIKTGRRFLKEWGVPFWLFLIILPLLFALLYITVKQNSDYAPYAISYLGFSVLFSSVNRNRIHFLKTLFSPSQYVKIRIVEKSIVFTPLGILCVFNGFWWTSLLLILLFILSFLWQGIELFNTSMPTPFARQPFEFIVLFRKMWFLYLLLYLIAIIGIWVSNSTLSLVMLALIYLTSMQAYDTIEPEEIIWNYNIGIRKFLFHKIKRGVWQITLLTFPLLIALCIFFWTQSLWIAMIWGGANLLLILLVLIKYAIYPRRINLIDSIVITFVAVLPFFIPFLYFYYYRKACEKLKKYGL